MPYAPTTWVDGVTKLGPTNLNKLEQGLAAAASPTISNVAGLQAALGIYSATPPASPADGDQWIFPADAAGTLWRFRYNSASASVYKWEFVGGSDLVTLLAATETTTTTTTWLDLPTVGPRVVVPRSGEYDIVGSAGANHTLAGALVYIGLAVNAGGPGVQAQAMIPVAGYWVALPGVTQRVAAVAGDDLRMRYYNLNAGTVSYINRWVRVRPVRVS